MQRILRNKWIVIVALCFLFLFTIVVSFHFFQQSDKPKEAIVEPLILPSNEDLEFQNHSSLSEDEVKSIVNLTKEKLHHLFYESSMYRLKDIIPSVSLEEDESYVVFDELFLQTLESFVTEDIYYPIFNKMTLLKSDANHTFYKMNKNAFDSIYFDSAIAELKIESSSLRLISATDEKINANVSLCLEKENCESGINYPFELVKVNNVWKINKFQN